MVLTRYTFRGQGIFRSLHKAFEEADMSAADEQDLFDAEEVFERDMEVPEICTDSSQNTTSWFTEEGVKEFAEALDTICYYAGIYLDDPVKIECMEYQGVPLYKDCFQAVLAA